MAAVAAPSAMACFGTWPKEEVQICSPGASTGAETRKEEAPSSRSAGSCGVLNCAKGTVLAAVVAEKEVELVSAEIIVVDDEEEAEEEEIRSSLAATCVFCF